MADLAYRLTITDTNAVIDLIAEAIDDSMGPDWTSFDAAHHVMQWLTDAGLAIIVMPKRGTDCPSSPTGFNAAIEAAAGDVAAWFPDGTESTGPAFAIASAIRALAKSNPARGTIADSDGDDGA